MANSKTRDRVTPLLVHSAQKAQRFIVLPNGRLIPEALAYAFRDQVKRRAPLLSRDRRYKLEQICGGVVVLFSRRRERSMTIACTGDAGDE